MRSVTFLIFFSLMLILECHPAEIDKDVAEDKTENLSDKKLDDDYVATLRKLEDFLVKKKEEIDAKLDMKDTTDTKEIDAKLDKKEIDAKLDKKDAVDTNAADVKMDKKQSVEEVLASVEARAKYADFDTAVKSLLNVLVKKDELPNDTPKKAHFHEDSAKEIDTSKIGVFGIDKKASDEEKCTDAKGLNYCYKKAFANECHLNPKQMEKDCARSCRFCCSDDQSVIGVKKCKQFDKMKLCSQKDYQDRLRIFCPKTCGFCGRQPVEPPCVRSKYGCCWDGAIAKDHVGTVTDGCKPCKDYYSESFCQNFKNDCTNSWSLAGTQIRNLCPKTCGRCGPHKICQDDPTMLDSCFKLAVDGSCVSNFHVMKFSCPKSCNICHKSTIDCKDTKFGCCSDGKTIAKGYLKEGCKECTDIASSSFDCDFLKKHNACTANKDRMKVLCPATCGFCDA